jgi:hypothetical protein
MLTMLTTVLVAAAQPAPNPWYTECSNDTRACYSYVLGVIETTRFLGKACPKEPIGVEQLTTHILATMNAPGDAETKALSFSGLVIAALESSYPCK